MKYIKKNTRLFNSLSPNDRQFTYEAAIVEIIDETSFKGDSLVRLVDGSLWYVPTNSIVERDYETIIYRYTLIGGQVIEKQGKNLETIILDYRKKLKSNKENRAQRNSLKYRFVHDLDFMSA